MSRGEEPAQRANRSFITAQGRSVSFDSAYYSDGISDSLVGNISCSPTSCFAADNKQGIHVGLVDSMDYTTRGNRYVPIFFRVERPHTEEPIDTIRKQLSEESQRFLAGVDFSQLSRSFQ